jgi:hypothetical protein
MEKIIVELEAKTNKALKGIDGVAKSVEELNKEVTNSNKDTAKGLKGVEAASQSVGKGLKTVGSGLKALGIGLVIASLSTLKELFSQNQVVVDLFNIAFETASVVVGQVTTAFKDIYKSLTQSTEQFDALGKVMSGLLTLVLTPFKNTFYEIQLAVQSAQLAWEKSVFGDKDPKTIKALNKSISDTKVQIIQVGNAAAKAGKDVVDNFGEAITEVGEAGKTITKELGEVSVTAAVKAATANVELQKSAELAAAKQGLLFEKFDRAAEKLRQTRDEERNSIEDRKKANDELLVKIDAAEKGMLREAKMQLTLANANLKKDKNNTEFKVAQIEALKEVAGVEAQIEGIRSEQKANDLALDRESIELTKSITESESILSVERKRFNAELIDDELLKLERLKEVDLLFQEKEMLRLENLVNVANLGTQAKVDAQIVLDNFMEESRQTNLTREKEITEQEIKNEKTTADAKAAILDAQLNTVSKGFSLLGQLAGKNKTLQAAALVGEAAVSIAKMVAANNLANIGALATPQAILTSGASAVPVIAFNNVTTGIGIAATAAATAKGLGSLGAGGSAPSSSGGANTPTPPPIESTPPSFNVVGQSETNQLAGAIGGQSKTPQRAYVVSGDVSTSQELDRNIVKSASI